MEYRILHRPSFSILEVVIEPGESIQAEAGAMVYMDPSIKITTGTGGGFVNAIKRKFMGGESFFINKFTATASPGKIGLAPSYFGDIKAVNLLPGEIFYAQKGTFLAGTECLKIDTEYKGTKFLIGGEGLFLLKFSCSTLKDLKNTGGTLSETLFLSSFGGIVEKEIRGGEFIVDTSHLVGFKGDLEVKIKSSGGIKTTLFGKEGLVMEFKGSGVIYIQTRSMSEFLKWINSYMEKIRRR